MVVGFVILNQFGFFGQLVSGGYHIIFFYKQKNWWKEKLLTLHKFIQIRKKWGKKNIWSPPTHISNFKHTYLLKLFYMHNDNPCDKCERQ